ncbi:hypothetical protein ACP4OV_010870 [Aristida adscensionis]
MLHERKAKKGGIMVGNSRRQCMARALSMLIAATLAFVAYTGGAGAGGLYNRWSLGRSGQELPAAAAATAAGVRAPTTLSHIVFGIGSSARTWEKRRGYAELWWRPGKMRGHVWLDEAPATPWPAAKASPPYRVSADASRFKPHVSASRIARIVADAFTEVTANGTAAPEVRWFVMGDDDTVFFPDNLVSVLRRYDHKEMYYVGAPSESVEQDVRYSYGTAYGGGGFAVSYPAAAELARAMDGCLGRYWRLYGSDERVHACLAELGVPLTREPGFHQMDVRGDAYGLLAAHPVAPLVSLHHLDALRPVLPGAGRTPLDAVRPLVGASRLDPARTLQQSFCYHRGGAGFTWSVAVAWGYAVQLYPWGAPPRELETPLRTFRTWDKRTDGPFVFNTRAVRENDACARPLAFFLSDVRRNDTAGGGGGEGGGTVSEYARHVVTPEKQCDKPSFRAASAVETVRVVAPQMSPSEWQRAPRRHCCKVEKAAEESVLEVHIHRCGGGELATPP